MSVVIEAKSFPIVESSLPKADPCVIVIFGALGDLATRGLAPALFRLAGAGCLSGRFKVTKVGVYVVMDDALKQ